MVRYPYYNNIDESKEIYLSDLVVTNCKFLYYGFMLAIITKPSLAFADEVNNMIPNIPIPTSPPNGKVPTETRTVIQGVVGSAGCGAALANCGDVGNQAMKAASNKMSTINTPTAVAVAGCLLLAGYCAGKVTTKVIDKALGFA